jgi:hypothetical protein
VRHEHDGLGVREVIKVVILACLVQQREVVDVIDREQLPLQMPPKAGCGDSRLA